MLDKLHEKGCSILLFVNDVVVGNQQAEIAPPTEKSFPVPNFLFSRSLNYPAHDVGLLGSGKLRLCAATTLPAQQRSALSNGATSREGANCFNYWHAFKRIVY